MLVDADLPTAATLAAPTAPPSRRRSLATLVRTGAESAAAAASSTRRGASSKMRRVAQVALQLPLVRPAARKVWGKLRDGDASSDVEAISDGESSESGSDADSTTSSSSSAHAADVSARDPDPDSDATSASSSPSSRFRAPWTRIRRSHRRSSRRRRQVTPFSDSSVSTLPPPRALPTHPLARLGIPAQTRTRAGVVTPLGGRDEDEDDEGGDESVGQPLMVVLDPPPNAQRRPPAISSYTAPLCRRVAVNLDQLRTGPIDVDDGRRWLFFRLDPRLRRATHAVVVELAHHCVYVGDVSDADAVDLVAIGSARSVAVVDLDKAVVAGDAPPLALLLLGETQVLGLVAQSERDKRLFVRYLPFAAQDAWWADPAADEEEKGEDPLDWEFDDEGRERSLGMSELTALMRDLDAAHSAAADRYAHLQTTIAHTAAELREYRHLLGATDRAERSLRASVPLPTPPSALATAVAEDLARHTALLRNRSKVLALTTCRSRPNSTRPGTTRAGTARRRHQRARRESPSESWWFWRG
ncbi:hypothetical protein AMAG_07445 [Allomyces macrogynus ATCC 38327]|uniref:Uncharacterized protein n=1 Tax=Allomyces macrogynus (strain ATCC 38327) TaxID=578462 RepID=A0A0L0SI61_ALLM3|nr:hypothetical protein AMAG_07445 [Allomyces macrogynus ATCC 38327]|eukprot:KNE62203.1 hypothetical protein AMAG_07445 [Allomyces macrogynus ATCC 38327]